MALHQGSIRQMVEKRLLEVYLFILLTKDLNLVYLMKILQIVTSLYFIQSLKNFDWLNISNQMQFLKYLKNLIIIESDEVFILYQFFLLSLY